MRAHERRSFRFQTTSRRPGSGRTPHGHIQEQHRPARHRLDPDRVGRHSCHLLCHHRGGSAALDEGAGCRGRLDHGRVFHAAVLHAGPQTPRQLKGQDRWTLAGNSAVDRSLHARSAGSRQDRASHRLDRLRRVAGRWRDANGFHHRGIRCTFTRLGQAEGGWAC